MPICSITRWNLQLVGWNAQKKLYSTMTDSSTTWNTSSKLPVIFHRNLHMLSHPYLFLDTTKAMMVDPSAGMIIWSLWSWHMQRTTIYFNLKTLFNLYMSYNWWWDIWMTTPLSSHLGRDRQLRRPYRRHMRLYLIGKITTAYRKRPCTWNLCLLLSVMAK